MCIQDIANDCFQRAANRRSGLELHMAAGHYVEVVTEAMAIIDLVMLGTMASYRQPLSPEEVAQGRPSYDTSEVGRSFRCAQQQPNIERLFLKKSLLRSAPVGSVLPSKLYTESDAQAAIMFCDTVIKTMIHAKEEPSHSHALSA